ncbi:MAG: UvrD-helicase domain-containing protein [Phycisphaerales bacterium]|nr:UvrD-helicase domain-containing protein [Phycisphaerales bacterium]
MNPVGTLITANAGCGKTFTLANRVLGWMVTHYRLTGSSGARDILAATFTRKAAGEIQQRILRHLARGAIEPQRLADYEQSIGLEEPATQSELLSVLEDVAREIDRLQINTLDGVFHELARALPETVGLPQGWSIGDQPALAALQRASIDDWLDGSKPDQVEEFAAAAEGEVLKGSMHGAITKTIWGDGRGGGLLELWRRGRLSAAASGQDPWRWLEQLSDDQIAPMARRVSAEEIKSSLDQLASAPIPLTQGGTPNKRWVVARERVLESASEGRWSELLVDSMVLAVVRGVAFNRAHAPAEMEESLAPLIGQACQHLVDRVRLRHGIWELLLNALGTASEAQQQQAGLFGFSDVSARLATADILSPESLSALAWRLDATIRDLALDEFQDTSVEQARVLLPLIDEFFAGEGAYETPRHMLVVADPKQSIYGWRGGTPELIQWLRLKGGTQLGAMELAMSYRSSPMIMSFVNASFRDIASNAAVLGEQSRRPAADVQLMGACHLMTEGPLNAVDAAVDRWIFAEHTSAPMLANEPGLVHAHVASKDDAAERAADIVERRVSKGGTIGVLCPTNDTLTSAADAIRDRGIPVSEEGGGGIKDVVAAARLLEVLTLGDHPGNTLAGFNVSHSPFGRHVGLCPLEECADNSEACGIASRSVRSLVTQRGLSGAIGHLVDAVDEDVSSRERSALGRIVLMASEWGDEHPRRLSDFVAHVNQIGLGQATEDRVRVMTMHASKGLEFDEVVLPWLDTKMVQERPPACQGWSSDALGTLSAIAPTVSTSERIYTPLLSAMHEQAFAGDLADRISLLYVAITRARHGLHLIFAPIVKSNGINAVLSPATFLRAALPDLETALEDVDASQRTPIWKAAGSQNVSWDKKAQRRAKPRPPVSLVSREVGTEITPSSHGSMPLRERCRLLPGRARRDGVILHELFRGVRWMEDGPPDASAIDSAFEEAAIQLGRPVGPDQREALQSRFEEAMSGEAGKLLRRDAHAAWEATTLEVFPEHPLLADVEDGLMRGQIDRLVIGRDANGVAIAASIIDYKTGSHHTAETRAAAEQLYASQLERYAQGVSAVFEIPASQIQTRLCFIA